MLYIFFIIDHLCDCMRATQFLYEFLSKKMWSPQVEQSRLEYTRVLTLLLKNFTNARPSAVASHTKPGRLVNRENPPRDYMKMSKIKVFLPFENPGFLWGFLLLINISSTIFSKYQQLPTATQIRPTLHFWYENKKLYYGFIRELQQWCNAQLLMSDYFYASSAVR